MEGNGRLLTIREASNFSGMSIPAIYKHIKRGILSVEYDIIQGRKIKKVRKEDLVKVYGTSDNAVEYGRISDNISDNTVEYGRIPDNIIEYDKISDIIRENIKQALDTEKTQLLKPLEDQALYRLGRMEKEVEDLRAEKEILLQELDRYKALPGPVEEVKKKIKEQEATISALQSEKEQIITHSQETIQEKEFAIQTIQVEKKKTIETLQTEKEAAINEKEQLLSDTERELKNIKKNAEELQQQKKAEAQEYQKKIEEKEQEEKDLLATVEALKVKLQEEQNKSWWQKLFGG